MLLLVGVSSIPPAGLCLPACLLCLVGGVLVVVVVPSLLQLDMVLLPPTDHFLCEHLNKTTVCVPSSECLPCDVVCCVTPCAAEAPVAPAAHHSSCSHQIGNGTCIMHL